MMLVILPPYGFEDSLASACIDRLFQEEVQPHESEPSIDLALSVAIEGHLQSQCLGIPSRAQETCCRHLTL